MRARNRFALAGPFVATGILAYLPSLRGGWLWDDHLEITDNPMLRDPWGWLKCWWAPAGADYLPLKDSALWLERHLWHLAPLGYHAVNLGLHLASAFLLWRLLARLGASHPWLGGLLFLLHPLAVESVAWIAEFKNALALPFLLLALGAFVDGSAGAASAAFAASLLCKSSGVMLPLVLLSYAWWKEGRLRRSAWIRVLPCIAASFAAGIATLAFQARRGLADGIPPLHLDQALLALPFYLGKVLMPAGLSPVYPALTARSFATIPFALAAGLLFAALGLAIRERPAWRAAGFGFASFVLNLLPILGFVPMAYLLIAPVADHLAYVSLAAACGLGGAAMGAAIVRFRRPATVAALAVLAALLVGTRRYTAVFSSSEALWTRAAAAAPGSALAHNNLGAAEAAQGRLAEGLAEFREAVRLDPAYAEARGNLAHALLKLGVADALAERWNAALAELAAAVRLTPDDAEAHLRYALALWRAGHAEEAIAQRAEALRLDPSLPR